MDCSYFGGVVLSLSSELILKRVYPQEGLGHFGRRVREFCKRDGSLWIGTEDKGI